MRFYLDVEAGDDSEVVKVDLADGWSLVKNDMGEVGLLPRAYYTVGGCHSVLTARLTGSGLWYIVYIRFYSSPKQTLAVETKRRIHILPNPPWLTDILRTPNTPHRPAKRRRMAQCLP
jgi:hypothetical protein